MPNFDCAPAVRTWAWWPRPRPGTVAGFKAIDGTWHAGEVDEFPPLAAPPLRGRPLRSIPLASEELAPGGAEDRAFHLVSKEEPVELAHQPLALLLVDDEGEVEVRGRLRHEMNLQLLERLQHRPELMQNGADSPPHQRERCGRSDDLRLAERREI